MKLFTHRPAQYVDPGTDLPIEYLQKQLDRDQAEYDLQQAGINKYLESFLNIQPGMLTKDRYEELKNEYIPKINEIRDNLTKTGSIGQAAQSLSGFVQNLATDWRMKDVLEDAKLTELHQKDLLDGKNTNEYVGLYQPDGSIRPQLKGNEKTGTSHYRPALYGDVTKTILEETSKIKENITSEVLRDAINNNWTEEQIKSVTAERLEKYAKDRLNSLRNDPNYSGFFIRNTNYGATPFDEENLILKPVRDLAYSQNTKQFHPGPQTNVVKNGGGGGETPFKPNKTTVPVIALHTGTNDINVWNPTLNENITAFNTTDQINKHNNNIQRSYSNLLLRFPQVTKLGLGVKLDNQEDIDKLNNWINNNYDKDSNGNFIPNNPNVPLIDKELSDDLNNITNNVSTQKYVKQLVQSIEDETGVKDYDPNKIKNVEEKTLKDIYELTKYDNMYRADSDWYDQYDLNKKKGANELAAFLLKTGRIDKTKYDEVLIEYQTKLQKNFGNSDEGKYYKAFENLKNRLSQMQIIYAESGLSGEDLSNLDNTVLNMLINSQLKGLTEVTSGIDASKGTGLKEAIGLIPVNKESGAYDTKQVNVGIGFDQKKGAVGIVQMGGKTYKFDMSSINMDELIGDKYPELIQKMRIYQQIADNSSKQLGQGSEFNIGSVKFSFDQKHKKIGTDNPEFFYEYNFDGNKKFATNVGQIIEEATNIANKRTEIISDAFAIQSQELKDIYTTEQTNIQKEHFQKLKELETNFQLQINRPVNLGKQIPQTQGNSLGW
jgi:hypothetical protein